MPPHHKLLCQIRDLAVTASLNGFAKLPGDWHNLTNESKANAAKTILEGLAARVEENKNSPRDLVEIVWKFLALMRPTVRENSPSTPHAPRAPRKPGRIRIAFLLPVFQFGGVESWTISLCRELRNNPQLGIDVIGVGLILGDEEDSQPNPTTLAELQFVAPVVASGRQGSTTLAARDGREVVRILGVNADVLVVWSLPQLGWLLGGLDSVPLVVGVSHGCADWWMREAVDSVDHWAAVSRAAIPPIPKAARDAGRVSVVLNGIDLHRIGYGGQGWHDSFPTARTELGVPPAGKLAVSVGRVSPEKQLATVAAALKYLPDTYLAIVGGIVGEAGEEEAARIREAASQAGAADRLAFIPPTRDPSRWLAAADSFVVNSASEGYCLAAVEAMAALVPLVSTRVGVLQEPEFDGLGEWLEDDAKPRQIAAALAKVHRGGMGLQQRRAAASRAVRERHSSVAMAGRWAELLGRLVEEREGREARGEASQKRLVDVFAAP